MARRAFFLILGLVLLLEVGAALLNPIWLWSLLVVGPIAALGIRDCLQTRHTILRNFPVIGHFRYGLESVRPEIQQYFIETNLDAFPIEREFRALAYQRAKGELETQPFGTQRDLYRMGYEWASHAMQPLEPLAEAPRVRIGGTETQKPHEASLLNVSAMSFGALSGAAIRALGQGARAGGFALNTGEGGLSSHHLETGAALVWQVGTGYFGCRDREGGFDPGAFAENARRESVRMVELKLSQGAKPGHGGVLPGVKVTEEIAAARGVAIGRTVHSPPAHSAFDSPRGLLEFVRRLRELSGGKPVGVKCALGRRTDFLSILKAMRETGIRPDYLAIDGGEGGTGAAPLEFANSLGMPARDAWVLAHSLLRGAGLRDEMRIVASGKILTSFHMVRALALGADLCASARGFMLALGCIQALRCNANTCPTGITTQDPRLVHGLVVADKAPRVTAFHEGTLRSFLELLGAMGLERPEELEPHHVFRRIDDLRIRQFAEIYEVLEPGQLLEGKGLDEDLQEEWRACRTDRWLSGRFREHVATEGDVTEDAS